MARGNIQSILRIWKKSTTIEKIFYICLVVIGVYVIGTFGNKTIENFEQSARFITKRGPEIYDDFYVSVYDDLLFNEFKNDYEIGQIINRTSPTAQSTILDIGSGTGHHVGLLSQKGFKCQGIDNAPAMIKKSKENYPDCTFKLGDVMKSIQFQPGQFTHITCMYFTIYMIKDKRTFFQNCMSWLKPGGHLVLHLVNRDKFDPILPVADVLAKIDPQDYADKRITSTKAAFNNHLYEANFELKGDTAYFKEKFLEKKGNNVRQNNHELYMPSQKEILSMASASGFILVSKTEMKKVNYNNQFIYVLQKPR